MDMDRDIDKENYKDKDNDMDKDKDMHMYMDMWGFGAQWNEIATISQRTQIQDQWGKKENCDWLFSMFILICVTYHLYFQVTQCRLVKLNNFKSTAAFVSACSSKRNGILRATKRNFMFLSSVYKSEHKLHIHVNVCVPYGWRLTLHPNKEYLFGNRRIQYNVNWRGVYVQSTDCLPNRLQSLRRFYTN